ncbi:unnamed protein product [Vitrella brassicaformis CCMP3155]|uniref:SH3 domain-containing protein n=2 Tax=Vitrella brassicaformis TaxID=1169539 RepID=A0A0G4GN67_VITBC|nr:unnamed protein product [Vitrella brassicaformis CCMP3155]|eukprot:CEM31583.1 unnamed protein product [Vitrella brassicaformis CCMP3155]
MSKTISYVVLQPNVPPVQGKMDLQSAKVPSVKPRNGPDEWRRTCALQIGTMSGKTPSQIELTIFPAYTDSESDRLPILVFNTHRGGPLNKFATEVVVEAIKQQKLQLKPEVRVYGPALLFLRREVCSVKDIRPYDLDMKIGNFTLADLKSLIGAAEYAKATQVMQKPHLPKAPPARPSVPPSHEAPPVPAPTPPSMPLPVPEPVGPSPPTTDQHLTPTTEEVPVLPPKPLMRPPEKPNGGVGVGGPPNMPPPAVDNRPTYANSSSMSTACDGGGSAAASHAVGAGEGEVQVEVLQVEVQMQQDEQANVNSSSSLAHEVAYDPSARPAAAGEAMWAPDGGALTSMVPMQPQPHQHQEHQQQQQQQHAGEGGGGGHAMMQQHNGVAGAEGFPPLPSGGVHMGPPAPAPVPVPLMAAPDALAVLAQLDSLGPVFARLGALKDYVQAQMNHTQGLSLQVFELQAKLHEVQEERNALQRQLEQLREEKQREQEAMQASIQSLTEQLNAQQQQQQVAVVESANAHGTGGGGAGADGFVRFRCEVLYDYGPQSEDYAGDSCLEIEKGQILDVLSVADNGWFLARNNDTAAMGYLPSAYVREIAGEAAPDVDGQ